MATPDRDTVYTNDGTTRSVYTRESSSTGWFVGIVVALALLAIGYLVFSANFNPAPTTVTNTTITSPVTDPTPGNTPLIEAPATSTDTSVTPMAPASEPATTDVAPAAGADVSPTITAPANESTAPAATTPAAQ